MFAHCGVGTAEPGLHDPVGGHEVTRYFLYDLREVDQLAKYRGRLVVDWGQGYRSWVQQAKKQDKPVVEIKRYIGVPKFPGFSKFRWRLSDLTSVPLSWRMVLSSVSGVYL